MMNILYIFEQIEKYLVKTDPTDKYNNFISKKFTALLAVATISSCHGYSLKWRQIFQEFEQ